MLGGRFEASEMRRRAWPGCRHDGRVGGERESKLRVFFWSSGSRQGAGGCD